MSSAAEKKSPDPIDIFVGSKLRARRAGMRISQTKLGDSIGVSFQQIQKYENGTNRICASKLYKISRQLNVEVAFFFEDLPEEIYEASQSDIEGLSEPLAEPFDSNPLSSKSALALVHDYERIPDDELRNRVSQFMRSLANSMNNLSHDDEVE